MQAQLATLNGTNARLGAHQGSGSTANSLQTRSSYTAITIGDAPAGETNTNDQERKKGI